MHKFAQNEYLLDISIMCVFVCVYNINVYTYAAIVFPLHIYGKYVTTWIYCLFIREITSLINNESLKSISQTLRGMKRGKAVLGFLKLSFPRQSPEQTLLNTKLIHRIVVNKVRNIDGFLLCHTLEYRLVLSFFKWNAPHQDLEEDSERWSVTFDEKWRQWKHRPHVVHVSGVSVTSTPAARAAAEDHEAMALELEQLEWATVHKVWLSELLKSHCVPSVPDLWDAI